MKLNNIYLALAAGLLASCTSPQVARNKISASYNFDYTITAESSTNLSQVFDDKNDTYLTYSSHPDKTPNFYILPDKTPVPVTQSGNYWRVSGIYPLMLIEDGDDSAAVKNNYLTRFYQKLEKQRAAKQKAEQAAPVVPVTATTPEVQPLLKPTEKE